MTFQTGNKFNVFQAGENTEQGYISADIKYLAHLHDAHSNNPLVTTTFEIKSDMLSPN